ncbi:outer membrane protein [Aestuariivirga sp.]|uniref:outer membrane protein n=1 Tax=Aestuariivirga sp. TaxID=2650926 RepID=UPI003BACD5B2
MNKIRAIVLASSALMLASAAQAADIVAAPAPTWTGFYFGVGVGGGYSFADTSVAGGGFYDDYYEGELPIPQGDSSALELMPIYNVDTATVLGSFFCDAGFCSGSTGADAGFKDDQGKAGILGRAEIGADYQFDRIVAGVNASFTLGSREMSAKAGGSGGGDFYDSIDGSSGGGGGGVVNSSLDIGNSWSIGGRLGYLVTDSTLVFASGGYTQEEANLKARFQGSSGAGDEDGGIEAAYNVKASSDEWLDGYYIGGGLETLLTDHFSLKLEYRYADYGSIKAKKGDSFYGSCDGEACFDYGAGVKAKADVTDQSVVATISFRM